tara:strand:+ start:125 stop:358 length:234 start_codon:yes stop_codon:yes gene_type:complete
MNKEGQELVAELNLTIDELTDKVNTLKNERNAVITRNRQLHIQLRDLQEKYDKIKQPESLGEEMQREENLYGHVFNN